MIPGEAIDQFIRDHYEMFRRLGRGPTSTEWPCKHSRTETDTRNGQRYCTVCYHWIEGKA